MTYLARREWLNSRDLRTGRRIENLSEATGDLVVLLLALRDSDLDNAYMDAAMIARRMSKMLDVPAVEYPPVAGTAPIELMLYTALLVGVNIHHGEYGVAAQLLNQLTEWLLFAAAQKE